MSVDEGSWKAKDTQWRKRWLRSNYQMVLNPVSALGDNGCLLHRLHQLITIGFQNLHEQTAMNRQRRSAHASAHRTHRTHLINALQIHLSAHDTLQGGICVPQPLRERFGFLLREDSARVELQESRVKSRRQPIGGGNFGQRTLASHRRRPPISYELTLERSLRVDWPC
eukprot:scaffold438_cov250-Pinguiococcus_pyrenoidosus.AAC.7